MPAKYSKANPANFHPNWAGLAVLFSRQILNGSQDFFFHFNILFFISFFRYEIIETHARAFLTLNILGIATVKGDEQILFSLDKVKLYGL